MDTARFDKLAKWFSRGHSRRTVLRGTLGGAAAAAAGPATWARAHQATPPVATPGAGQDNWLLVVDFSGAAIAVSGDDAAKLTVTLSGVDNGAVAFTDRPQRLVRMVELEQVAAVINGASDDPLNALLVGRLPGSRESAQVVVELLSASSDVDAETLVLEAGVLVSEALATPVPMEAGRSTSLRAGDLFIDNVILVEIVSEAGAGQCEGQPCNPVFPDCCQGYGCLPWGGPVIGSCVKKT